MTEFCAENRRILEKFKEKQDTVSMDMTDKTSQKPPQVQQESERDDSDFCVQLLIFLKVWLYKCLLWNINKANATQIIKQVIKK